MHNKQALLKYKPFNKAFFQTGDNRDHHGTLKSLLVHSTRHELFIL